VHPLIAEVQIKCNRLFHVRQQFLRGKILQLVLEVLYWNSQDYSDHVSRCINNIIMSRNSLEIISMSFIFNIGWVVRIYLELRSDDVESWKVFNKVLDLGTNSSRDHIDLCNATQVIRNRKLGDIFEMTWRWVLILKLIIYAL
jgi:hypothetical protein